MEGTRRFTRVKYNNKAIVEIDNVVVQANILNISLNGAYFELAEDLIFHKGDKWQLTFKLPNSEIILQFETEVINARGKMVEVKFVRIDIDTMIHLRSLLEARTANTQQIADEFVFLTT